jgi:hypothetical protein
MSRTPHLERRVGSDVLARWPAHGGRLIMGLVLAHAGAAVQAWASGRGRTWLRRSSLCSAYLGCRGDRRHRRILAVIGMSVWATRRRVSYGTWHAIHLLTYGAVALSFVHELVGPTSPPGRCCRCCGR